MSGPRLPASLAERYTPLRIIGRGGMGVVLEATDLHLKRSVALKLILQNGPITDEVRAYFAREARSLAAISHPCVVRVLDGDVAGDTPYLAMELLEGASLYEIVHDELPSAATLCGWLDQLLDALTYVHERKMLHRDLKPSNIFIEDSGRPVLIDFGLVSNAESTRLTATGVVLGTPRFLAPELLANAPPSPASDLFALAMTALEALTGRSVHTLLGQPARVEAVLQSVRSGSYFERAREELGAGPVAEVLLRALAFDPKDRYPDAPTMRAALARAAANQARPRTGERAARRQNETPQRAVRTLFQGSATPRPGARGTGPRRMVRFAPLVLLAAGVVGVLAMVRAPAPVPPPVESRPALASADARPPADPFALIPHPHADALRMRVKDAISPASKAMDVELTEFRAWVARQPLQFVTRPTRESKHVFLAQRRRGERGPAINAMARDLERAIDLTRPTAREFLSRDQPAGVALDVAFLLAEMNECAYLLDVLGKNGTAQLLRAWMDGQPETLAGIFLRSLTHRNNRDHSSRARELEAALARVEARRARTGPVLEDALAVGMLTSELLDGLRLTASRDTPRMRAGLDRWSTWLAAFPGEPRLLDMDRRLRAVR